MTPFMNWTDPLGSELSTVIYTVGGHVLLRRIPVDEKSTVESEATAFRNEQPDADHIQLPAVVAWLEGLKCVPSPDVTAKVVAFDWPKPEPEPVAEPTPRPHTGNLAELTDPELFTLATELGVSTTGLTHDQVVSELQKTINGGS